MEDKGRKGKRKEMGDGKVTRDKGQERRQLTGYGREKTGDR